ncbi:MAG: efflux RND transporter periplasmic adaptor subunit [Candidatus Paceibacterota bacterium]
MKKDVLIKFIIPIVVIVLAFSALAYKYYLNQKNLAKYETETVKKADVVEEVSSTGTVKPSHSVDLAFEKSGRISEVNVSVGDYVYSGAVLASLGNSDIESQIEQAKAKLEAEQAKLDELKVGTRPEEIRLVEIQANNAVVSYNDSKQNLFDKINDSYTRSDDSIHNQVDQFMSNPRGPNPQLSFITPFSDLKSKVENGRVTMESTLNNFSDLVNKTNLNSDLEIAASSAQAYLSSINNYLDDVADLINSMTPNSNVSQTTIDAYKADVSASRTSTNAAISNLSAATEKLKTAKSTLDVANQNLVVKKAGSTPEDIKAQQANVNIAQASFDNVKAELGKYVIYSPIDGVVAKQNAKRGEIATAQVSVISINSSAQFEIESNIPESDIAKIKVGQSAEVTLDAYGDGVLFEAVVSSVEPDAKIIEGVPTYKTVLQFKQKDDRIKSGMTANINIVTNKKQNVLIIPSRSAFDESGIKYVNILENGQSVKKEIQVGLRGTDGNSEILSGINENDKVIIFVKNN